MRLSIGQELRSPATGVAHITYRVSRPLHESVHCAFYEAKRFFWNVNRKTGGRGELCQPDDALDVVLKTIIYARPDDKAYAELRRKGFDRELKFLKTRTTNLIPEPLDELSLPNDQDAFTFWGSERFRRSEPILVFEKVHGITLAEFMKAHPGGLAAGGARHLLLELIDFMQTLQSKRWSCCHLSPEQIIVDKALGIYITGTGSFCQMQDGIVDLPEPDLRRAAAGFSAPEVSRGSGVDRRADYFTWGALAAFILTGRPPVVSSSGEAQLDATAAGIVRRAGGALGQLIDRCLSTEPADRPPDIDALRRWWDHAPPARPRWALGLVKSGENRGRIFIETTGPWVEVVSRNSAVLDTVLASAVVNGDGPVVLDVSSPLSTLAVRAVDDEERSPTRVVRVIDPASAADVRKLALELLPADGACTAPAPALPEPLRLVLTEGGLPARRALAEAQEPSLRRLGFDAALSSGDDALVVAALRAESAVDLRRYLAARGSATFAGREEKLAAIAAIAIPAEPWAAVQSELDALHQLGAPRTWLDAVRRSRWDSQTVHCSVCRMPMPRRAEVNHYEGTHGLMSDNGTWIQPERWRSLLIERLKTDTAPSNRLGAAWPSLDTRFGRKSAVETLIAAGLETSATLAHAVRGRPAVALVTVEQLLAGAEAEAIRGVALASKLVGGPDLAGCLLRHAIGHQGPRVRRMAAEILVRDQPANAARIAEVARRLVRAEKGLDVDAMTSDLATAEAFANAAKETLETFGAYNATKETLHLALTRLRDDLPTRCSTCAATVRRGDLDSHLWREHGLREFRGRQLSPLEALGAAVAAVRENAGDEAAIAFALDSASKLVESAAELPDRMRAFRELLTLRASIALPARVDAMLDRVDPWRITPDLVETGSCEITCHGPSLDRRATCKLRSHKGEERLLKFQLSHPAIGLGIPALVSLSLALGAAVAGTSTFLTLCAMVFGVWVGYRIARRFSGAALEAADVVFTHLLPHFHDFGYDVVQGRFLARLLTGRPLPRATSDLVLWDTAKVTFEAHEKAAAGAAECWPLVRAVVERGLSRTRRQGARIATWIRCLAEHDVASSGVESKRTLAALDDGSLIALLDQLHEPKLESTHVSLLTRIEAARQHAVPEAALRRLNMLHLTTVVGAASRAVPLRAAMVTLRLLENAADAGGKDESLPIFMRGFLEVLRLAPDDSGVVAELDDLLTLEPASPWRLCARTRAVAASLPHLPDGHVATRLPGVAKAVIAAGGDVRVWEAALRRLGRLDGKLERARSLAGLRTVLELNVAERRRHPSIDLLALSSEGKVTAGAVHIGSCTFRRDPRPFRVEQREEFVQTGWTYQRKDGAPDMRYRNNPPRGYQRVTGVSICWSGGSFDMGLNDRAANQRVERLEALFDWVFS